MKKIAFLTAQRLATLLPYDRDVAALLSAEGHEVYPVVWDQRDLTDVQADLSGMDAIVIRTIWGYHDDPDRFRALVERIRQLGIPCWNPLDVMLENMQKTYLASFPGKGIKAIPTQFISKPSDLATVYENHNWEEVVIKPSISGGSKETWRTSRENADADIKRLEEVHAPYPFMVQPFLPQVLKQGEYSYLFFSNGYRYAVKKRPKEGDYRVQVQFGGIYEPHQAQFQEWQLISEIRDKLGWEFLYMRIDGVWVEGAFWVMEVEMLEPDLYLDIHPEGTAQFAKAILEKLNE